MSYDEAKEIVAEFTAGIEHDFGSWQPSAAETLGALAERDRLQAIRPAWAFATVWRHDVDTPGFTMPPHKLVGMVEYLINEPVWRRRYYNDDGSLIDG